MSVAASAQSWSSSQLIEYLAALSEQPDEAHARRAAVERALESLDAEVGVLSGADVGAPVVVGVAPDDERLAVLLATVRDGTTSVEIPGFGACRAALVALDVGPEATRLLVTRTRDEEFLPDEMVLLRGMAWVLDLVLRQLRGIAALNERQRVLEQVARAQRAIAGRVAVPEILSTVTESALSLFGSDLSTMHLVNHDELDGVSVKRNTMGDEDVAAARRLSAAVAEDVHRRDAFVRADADMPRSALADDPGMRLAGTAMGAPVRENGAVVGSLVVVSSRPGHLFSYSQEQALLTFADQISVALSDAKTLAVAEQAFRDQVTGLPGRTQFLDRLEHALARGQRVHVFFLDLDRFKPVNDTLGHAAGDELLRQAGRRLRRCVRTHDCLARIGGDEYAVLMDDASAALVRRGGHRMLSTVQQPFHIGGDVVTVGVSIGVARGRYPMTAGELLHNADTAMYQAKRAGGGRMAVFGRAPSTLVPPEHPAGIR